MLHSLMVDQKEQAKVLLVTLARVQAGGMGRMAGLGFPWPYRQFCSLLRFHCGQIRDKGGEGMRIHAGACGSGCWLYPGKPAQ